MGVLGDRLIVDGMRYRLRSDGRTVSDLLGQLESGELPAAVIAPGAVDAADVVAALAHDALGRRRLDRACRWSRPRRPVPGSRGCSRSRRGPGCSRGADRRSRLALAAGLLQIHDFWDASHEAAQKADDLGERDFSAYWHGIAHRREPDAGNAAYWFRRVGRHPLFTSLAEAARPLLDEHGDAALAGRLLSGGWDAMAMIDLCTRASPGSPPEVLARRLQRLEMWLLLEATFARLAGTTQV